MKKLTSFNFSIDTVRRLTLLLFVFLLCFEYWDALGIRGSFTVPKIAGAAYFALSLISFRKMLAINKSNRVYILLFFVLWCWLLFVSLVNHIYYGYDIKLNLTFLQLILMFWLIGNEIRIQPSMVNNIFISFILSVLLIYILISLGIGIQASREGDFAMVADSVRRVWFLGMNPNGLGTAAALSLMLSVGVAFDQKSIFKYRYLFLFFIPFFLHLIGMSGSAGAFLTIFIASIIYFLFKKQRFGYKPLYMFALIPLFLLVIEYFQNYESLINKVALFFAHGETSSRTALWKAAVTIYSDSPLFGLGEAGAYARMKDLTSLEVAHNVFIDVLLWGGVIALALYLSVYAKLLIKSLQHIKYDNNPLYLTLLAVIVLYMGKAGGGFSFKFAWVLFACIAAMPLNPNSSTQKEHT